MLIVLILYTNSEDGTRQLTAELSFARGPIAGGLALRQGSFNPDAVIFILGITPPDLPWTFGYSYDYTING